jgi:purine-binding chemotaxis protein CheW
MNKLGIAAAPAAPAPGSTAPAARYLVFRLGDEEYGLPIASVSEVAAIPASLTRLPKTPDFLEGVVNLRGEVLPVIDQRRRFGLSEFTGNARRRRLIVLRGAGMIVDAVSEVLGAPAEAISPAPALAGETTSLVEAVLNLEGRLILLLNPEDLLTGTEKKILEEAAF